MELNRQRFFLRDEQGRRLFLLCGACLRPWVAPSRDAENWLLRRLQRRWWHVLLLLPAYGLGGLLFGLSPFWAFLVLLVVPTLLTLVGRRVWLAGELRSWQRAPRLSLTRHMRLRARQTAPSTIRGALGVAVVMTAMGAAFSLDPELRRIGLLLALTGAVFAVYQGRMLQLARREPQPLPFAQDPGTGNQENTGEEA
jgi:hypothetical protein